MNPRRRKFTSALILGLAGGAAFGADKGESQERAAPGPPTWSFLPPPDEFSARALLDLRSLNEAAAGQSGFVRVGVDGGFVRGDGAPLRFWSVNTDVARSPFVAKPFGPKTAPDLARHARFLAKRGVNMVRLFRQLSPSLESHPDAVITDINEAERDSTWRAVAAMRKEGIYSTISPYWAHLMKFSKAWGIPGGADQPAWGLLFFDQTLQRGYKAWLKKLLGEKNPYTGIALASDPSVAILEIQNEDSLLFWTSTGIKGAQREALERLYGVFLTKKYGALAQAMAAWKGDRTAADAPDAGRVGLLDLWELTKAGSGGHGVRLSDQTEFYARTMYDFNRGIVDYLRGELGARQLINAGNWRTASNVRLGDVERWSYTSADVDAANVYTGGIHQGPNNGWALLNGDRFTSESVLLNPKAMPVNLKQTAGRPMLVTEGAWVMPNGYAAEGPFLVAAYSSLNGVAGYYWFNTGDEGWTPPQSANGYMPSQAKWLIATPETLGSFPALALAYRKGYLKRGSPVVMENRALQDLWDRKTPILAEEASFDPNRDAGDIAPASSVKTGVPAEAFLVGPALVAFGADPAGSKAAPLSAWVDGAVVRADTGEIVLNAKAGFCTIDAPKVQGVAAHFARAPTHQLSDVRFSSGNAFGAATAVSLDDAPLRSSKHILVQYATESRPAGWQQAPARITVQGQGAVDGMEIKSYGGAPWRVVSADLSVAIRNPGLSSATVLDMNGMPLATLPLERSSAQVAFRFPGAAMYVVLR
jgi:hypothetical protein